MSILIRYAPASLTREQYDKVGGGLEAEGNWPPEGLLLHVCFGSGNQLRVSEIWESREKLEAFQQQLMPQLQQAGVDVTANEPEILEVQAIEVGANLASTSPTEPARA
jgi:hypothetical protein